MKVFTKFLYNLSLIKCDEAMQYVLLPSKMLLQQKLRTFFGCFLAILDQAKTVISRI